VLLQSGVVVGRRVRSLSAKDRRQLTSLLRASRGWPGRLTERERAELKKLLGKLDPGGIARDLMPVVRGRRKRRTAKGTGKRHR
jgi:hypothetical protein